MNKRTRVSIAVIRRLPKYYRYLSELLEKDIKRISSQELSRLTGFTASQIRQDLNNFGGFGQQGYGYNIISLHHELKKILGLDKSHRTIIIGAGNLGQAIANFRGFRDAGFETIALFDKNPKIIGLRISGLEVHDISDLEEFVKQNDIEIAVICTPKDYSQGIADRLVECGISGIWNFAPVDLVVPEDINVENVHLDESLYTLSYFLTINNEE